MLQWQPPQGIQQPNTQTTAWGRSVAGKESDDQHKLSPCPPYRKQSARRKGGEAPERPASHRRLSAERPPVAGGYHCSWVGRSYLS